MAASGAWWPPGSDHPGLDAHGSRRPSQALGEDGADLVLGPAEDGGYYLLALRPAAVREELFEEIPWSTGRVLEETLERADRIGLETRLLPTAADVDTAEDLAALVGRLAAGETRSPATARLLARWGRLETP
ncbi:MAG: DUF2064 domain-containing protein [Thermoanaerobaculia bacterium]